MASEPDYKARRARWRPNLPLYFLRAETPRGADAQHAAATRRTRAAPRMAHHWALVGRWLRRVRDCHARRNGALRRGGPFVEVRRSGPCVLPCAAGHAAHGAACRAECSR